VLSRINVSASARTQSLEACQAPRTEAGAASLKATMCVSHLAMSSVAAAAAECREKSRIAEAYMALTLLPLVSHTYLVVRRSLVSLLLTYQCAFSWKSCLSCRTGQSWPCAVHQTLKPANQQTLSATCSSDGKFWHKARLFRCAQGSSRRKPGMNR